MKGYIKRLTTIIAVIAVCCIAFQMQTNVYAADGVDIGDYLYMGNTNTSGYTGTPCWRVLDKDMEGNLYLMSAFLWSCDDENTFLKFNTIPVDAVPMEGYEDKGYKVRGSAWQGSIAQTWCKNFEASVLSGVNGLIIRPTTVTDDEFDSPDMEDENYKISYAWTKDILKNDKVFFLSAEEVNRYMPTRAERLGYLHNGEQIVGKEAWWLRSPRLYTFSECAGKILAYGRYGGYIGRQVVDSEGAARPAFWADASSNLEHYKCTFEYIWSNDNKSCTGKLKYRNTVIAAETVNTHSQVIKNATVKEEGKIRTTAVFTNKCFKDQQKESNTAKLKPREVYDAKLPKISIKKPSSTKKAFTAKWKKLSKKNQKKIQGIEIQVASNSAFTQRVTLRTVKKSKTTFKVKKLQPKRTYWVRARTYKKVNGIKQAGAWSKARKVKVK